MSPSPHTYHVYTNLNVGGGELISFLQHNHPYLTIDAVDIDASVVGLARRWFDYRDHDDDSNDDNGDIDDNDNDANDDRNHESELKAPPSILPDPHTKNNHNRNHQHASRDSHIRANHPHTKLTDAWAFLHTLAINISNDNSDTASSSSSFTNPHPSHYYYDYVLVDLFTAECTRPDNNDTNVHGNDKLFILTSSRNPTLTLTLAPAVPTRPPLSSL